MKSTVASCCNRDMALSANPVGGDGEKLDEIHDTSSKVDPSLVLKTTKTGILLVPQPTDDPDEPLVSY